MIQYFKEMKTHQDQHHHCDHGHDYHYFMHEHLGVETFVIKLYYKDHFLS